MKVVGTASTLEEATDAMAEQVLAAAQEAGDRRLRVGVGHGAAPEMAADLRARIAEMKRVDEIIDYVVGPAVGAHTGAGTAGAVFLARPVVI